jgi:hypothetical protein
MHNNNPNEKKYLAKYIKFFKSIGYVYQKKLDNEEYAINIIIKIPKFLSNPARNNNRINIKCSVEM